MVDEKQLRDAVKKTISRDDVKYVIGYEQGSYGFEVAPYFVQKSGEEDKIIFSPLCVNNLAVYPLLEEKLPLSFEYLTFFSVIILFRNKFFTYQDFLKFIYR